MDEIKTQIRLKQMCGSLRLWTGIAVKSNEF